MFVEINVVTGGCDPDGVENPPVSFMAIKIGTRWVQEIVKQSRTD
jgi:hypothetical protein